MKKITAIGGEPSRKGSILNIIGGIIMMIAGVLGISEMGTWIGIGWILVFAIFTVYNVLVLIGLIKTGKGK